MWMDEEKKKFKLNFESPSDRILENPENEDWVHRNNGSDQEI